MQVARRLKQHTYIISTYRQIVFQVSGLQSGFAVAK